MYNELDTTAEQYFAEYFNVGFDALLAPISESKPGGDDVRGNGVYRAIQEARREDDPSLPLGPWAHELKRADWDKVGEVAVNALAKKTKDLRIAMWLLEAEIHRNGFAGIAPCVMLVRELCELHWEHLYPLADGDDLEYRTNVIHWANEKLLPALRLVPITHTDRDENPLTWSDWEQAKRNDQIRASQSGKNGGGEGIVTADFSTAMAGTSTEWHLAQHVYLTHALDSLDALSQTLDRLCDEESPSLRGLSGLLEQIQMLIGSELHKRGVRFDEPIEDVPEAEVEKETVEEVDASRLAITPKTAGAIHDRAAAYARLAEAADYLMRIEPHSPTPYLVRRAIAWGSLNTAELYQELFIKYGGQLNIFEMLGIAVNTQGESR